MTDPRAAEFGLNPKSMEAIRLHEEGERRARADATPDRAATVDPDDERTVLRAMAGYQFALERGETIPWAMRDALVWACAPSVDEARKRTEAP